MFMQTKSRGFNLGAQFLFGVLTVLIGVAITIYLLVIFNDRLMPVPLVVEHVENDINTTLCYGDRHVTTLRYSLSHQLTIEMFYNYMDGKRIYTYNTLLDGHLVAGHSQPGEYVQPVVWYAPDLPPGDYNLAIILVMRGVNAAPVYTYVPFTMRKECRGQ